MGDRDRCSARPGLVAHTWLPTPRSRRAHGGSSLWDRLGSDPSSVAPQSPCPCDSTLTRTLRSSRPTDAFLHTVIIHHTSSAQAQHKGPNHSVPFFRVADTARQHGHCALVLPMSGRQVQDETFCTVFLEEWELAHAVTASQ
jgi:hypothetical protein